MRKISLAQICVFSVMYLTCVAGAVASAWGLARLLPSSDFRGVLATALAVGSFFVYLAAVFRAFSAWFPIEVGYIPPGSRQEAIYRINVLFFLMGFSSLMRSHLLPLPVVRVLYLALGAKLGDNTYSGGVIFDPQFVTAGRNCNFGQNSLLVPHGIENERLSFDTITVGNNVTVGAHAIVLQGVRIGNDALIASGAVVPKGTIIGDGEVWGGVPARLLKRHANEPAVSLVSSEVRQM